MKTKLAYGMLLMFILTSFAGVQQSAANFSVYASINHAFYADLDADGREDDVCIYLTIEVYNYRIYTDIDLYIGVTLPSGSEFWFLVEFTVKKSYYYGWIDMKFDTFNTALESGWYDASAVGFAESERFSIMETLTFDPPGGPKDGEASGTATFL